MAIFQMILFFVRAPINSVFAGILSNSLKGYASAGTFNAKTHENQRFKRQSCPNRRQACPAKPGWSSSMLYGKVIG
ncbi:hypothetical protein NPS46_14840 [Pseudomonas putida]|uniref:hypothetical protein n=1 Tax=Pseudomonas putida TaxID=303 RepID=UPI00236372B2|nr:hypothetical protein [Pseudomonas putida]MDD2053824.1 hypothetical protein [Pseudomonas putida]